MSAVPLVLNFVQNITIVPLVLDFVQNITVVLPVLSFVQNITSGSEAPAPVVVLSPIGEGDEGCRDPGRQVSTQQADITDKGCHNTVSLSDPYLTSTATTEDTIPRHAGEQGQNGVLHGLSVQYLRAPGAAEDGRAATQGHIPP